MQLPLQTLKSTTVCSCTGVWGSCQVTEAYEDMSNNVFRTPRLHHWAFQRLFERTMTVCTAMLQILQLVVARPIWAEILPCLFIPSQSAYTTNEASVFLLESMCDGHVLLSTGKVFYEHWRTSLLPVSGTGWCSRRIHYAYETVLEVVLLLRSSHRLLVQRLPTAEQAASISRCWSWLAEAFVCSGCYRLRRFPADVSVYPGQRRALRPLLELSRAWWDHLRHRRRRCCKWTLTSSNIQLTSSDPGLALRGGRCAWPGNQVSGYELTPGNRSTSRGVMDFFT